MSESIDTPSAATTGGEFSDATVVLNQSVCRLRMLVGKLVANFEVIDTKYQKVSLDGMARQCSALVTDAAVELESLQGLCWAAITSECEEGRQLTVDDWLKIGSEPPAWLRELFEGAVILNSMPDEESMANLAARGQVLVIRAPELRGEGLLPHYAAVMPEGFVLPSIQVWWPWVMASQAPVVLVPTDQPNVLQEVSSGVFLEAAQESGAEVPS